ncbi:hypothetical protein CFR79_04200 [Komagataeibacter saccharivorans]|nr:hypothetical protein CFR79_04200 [Komagataeibacter saccharivorans]GBQ40243.1 hypothetical protein AA0614_1932 [Komagataeibacter saccharivorans NRIC 0614]
MLAGMSVACAVPARATPHHPPAAAQATPQPRPDYDGLPDACLTHVITVPLLTNSGSPIIPATFNGVNGLAYISITQGRVGVYARTPTDFPVQAPVDIQTIAGSGTTYTTVLHDLRISNGAAQDVPALLEGMRIPQIGNQDVLGVIGYDILSNYNVLLDFPARRMILFLTADTPDCAPGLDWLGAGSTSVIMLPDATGRLTGLLMQVGDRPVRMEIEPGADFSSLSRRTAREIGLTKTILHDDMNVRTNAGKILNGHRHHFDNITIGSWHDLPLDANIEKTSYNVLGMNFLRRRRILISFPQGMLFMTPQQNVPDDRGQATHGLLSTRTAVARMVDTPPPAPDSTPAAGAAPASPATTTSPTQ